MAGALELVLSSDPRNHAAQMGADCIDSKVLNGSISADNEVGGVSPQPLGKRVVAGLMCSEPGGCLDVSSECILGSNASASTAGCLGNKEKSIGNGLLSSSRQRSEASLSSKASRGSHQGANGQADTSEEKEVHKVPLVHVGDLSVRRRRGQESQRLQQVEIVSIVSIVVCTQRR